MCVLKADSKHVLGKSCICDLFHMQEKDVAKVFSKGLNDTELYSGV